MSRILIEGFTRPCLREQGRRFGALQPRSASKGIEEATSDQSGIASGHDEPTVNAADPGNRSGFHEGTWFSGWKDP